MKVVTFRMPRVVVRDPQTKEVILTVDENKKEQVSIEDLGEGTQDIVSLSKKLADENEAQKEILRSSLFASQTKEEGFISLKYLAE